MKQELIWELMKQAGAAADEIFDQKGKMYGEIVMEKFAELIVRDVLDEVLQAMDDGMDVYDTVADKFGVEE